MNVAHVFIKPYNSGKLRAFANVIFKTRPDGDGVIIISGFKVFDGQNGLWVARPSQKKNNSNEYVDLVSLVRDKENDNKPTAESQEWMDEVSDAVLRAYNRAMQAENSSPVQSSQPTQARTQPVQNQFPIDDSDIPF
jgi:DNA-binding cell septation regulator SpoVG